MPELPEVETIKNMLRQLVSSKKIAQVDVYWPKIIKEPDDVEAFKLRLVGQTIHDVYRKGKFLLFELDQDMLISHLRMEGKYSLTDKAVPMDKHTHVVFSFTDGTELRYNDVRKFGTMHVFAKGQELLERPLVQLGPDPLESEFNFVDFYSKLQRTERAIKAVLLDQTIVAGLGNIYVDETLFKAGVHPLRPAKQLTEKEVKDIMIQAIETLQQAVKQGGTTIRSYINLEGEIGAFQEALHVYGQENQPCKKCGTPIEKFKVGGRGTHICSACQPLKAM